MFGGLFASIAAASTVVTDFTKEKVLRSQTRDAITLHVSPEGLRQAFWMNLKHEGLVRFELGTPGKEALASGVIHPDKLSAAQGRRYGIASIKGLRADLPLRLTLRSPRAFTIVGHQDTLANPYRIIQEGSMEIHG